LRRKGYGQSIILEALRDTCGTRFGCEGGRSTGGFSRRLSDIFAVKTGEFNAIFA